MLLIVFPVRSYGLFITRSFAFEGQKHVGQLSVCVFVCARAHTQVSDSIASSDKSPAGSTSLREEGKPQQCRTGGRGRLEREWWERWKIHEQGRKRGEPDSSPGCRFVWSVYFELQTKVRLYWGRWQKDQAGSLLLQGPLHSSQRP